MSIDIAAVRARVPALERELDGIPVAYFDGPGGTQVPREVVDAMADYLYRHNANTHWLYPSSMETDEIIAGAREALADFLNASPSEIAFGQNMTSLTFHISRAIGYGLVPGDEIVVTELDHHANIAPWQTLARERGVTLRTVRMIPETGQLDWDDLEHTIGRHTKLVAIGAASNALGTINDVSRVARLAHDVGARVFVDAVHYAAHELVDVQAIGCDYLACSAYKFHGPHIGVLFGKENLLAALDVPKLAPAPDSAPERLETGTQSHEAIAGAAAAVDFLASLGEGSARRARLQASFESLHQHGAALFSRLWSGLCSTGGVRLYGPPPGAKRTPTVSFTVRGIPAREVARHLAGCGVFVSSGDFYASTVVERLGESRHGLVRAGCACYTTEQEVDRLVSGVQMLVAGSAS
ncbi:MAG TPA: cysteine desulfurase-like protein [Gemmatimonadaceae bacterium]|nr:cysteine desulfurase-like protein [Gemmatimonadaceae bacterium]